MAGKKIIIDPFAMAFAYLRYTTVFVVATDGVKMKLCVLVGFNCNCIRVGFNCSCRGVNYNKTIGCVLPIVEYIRRCIFY